MTTLARRKLSTATRLFHTEGFKGVSRRLSELASSFYQSLHSNYFGWVLGKMVEIRGDMVSVDGLKFCVKEPSISTKMKSHFLFNQYEKPERLAIKQFLSVDLPLVEFGGAVGVVACHANKMLRNPRQHVVIEANPSLLSLLQENRDRNGCSFSVLNRAVAYNGGEVAFQIHEEFWGSNISNRTGSSVKVQTTNLQEVIEQFGFEQCSLICDIEGGEIELVKYEAAILKQRVQTIIMEVHPWCVQKKIIEDMLQRLEQIGFTQVYRVSDNYVMKNSSFKTS